MALQIECDIDQDTWSSFNKRAMNGNIFQSPEMFNVYEDTKNYHPIFLGVTSDDELVATLLAVIQKEYSSIFGRFTARSIIYGGPTVGNGQEASPAIRLLLQEYQKKVQKKVLYTQIRNYFDTHAMKPMLDEQGYVFEDHLNFHMDLTEGKDSVWKTIHKNRRKGINRAMNREGVLFKEVTDPREIEVCYALIKKTYDSVHIPLADISLFEAINRILCKKNMAKYFIAMREDDVIGCRLVLMYKDTIYDYFAGSDERHQDAYPNEFLVWKILEWGCENGYGKFDFGGAGHPDKPYGPREFKRRFGGDMVNFGRYEMVHRPLMLKCAKIGFDIWTKVT